jgi:23S rRNA pseudouridine1911/1915/1917 synthase
MHVTVVYEDNHLLALNKPAGMLVQGDKSGDPTLTDWGKSYLKEKYNKPGAVFLHPVHRIDRPVSGLVLFARTDKALGRLTTLFRDRKMAKSYLAICTSIPEDPVGTLRHFLRKDHAKNIVSAHITQLKDSKESITEYQTLGVEGRTALLLVDPKTGRPHQIRVQLAAMKCSILGDLKYGATEPLPDASIALHSFRLEFEHPVRKEPIQLQADLPQTAWWKRVLPFMP